MIVIPSIESVVKVGFMRWESIVSEGRTIFYYYSFTKNGAIKAAKKHITRRSQ